MPVSPPTNMYPVATSFWAYGREKTAPATPATAFTCIASAQFQPSDKPQWLEDQALRGAPVKTYDLQMGPLWGEHQIPESPVFGDTFPHILYNLFGDLTSTGTVSGTPWTTSAPLTPGPGPIPVTTGTAATAGTYVQIDSTLNAEIVKVGTGSTSTSIVVDPTTPIRFNHLNGVSVSPVTGPYTHTIAMLNMASSTGNASCQPPSGTLIHRTGLPGAGNNQATQYAYGCVSEVKITGKGSGMLTWEGKITSYARSYPSAPVTAAFSTSRMIPSWRSTNTIGGSLVPNITEWSATFTREMDIVTPADGQQAPYAIARGPMDSTFSLTYDVASDESALNHMLNNDQPTLAWAISNGLSGTSQVSLGIAAQLAGYKGSDLKPQKTMWGYDVSGELISNTTNVGNSGGYGSALFTIINNVPTY